jgi:hypothetical protein
VKASRGKTLSSRRHKHLARAGLFEMAQDETVVAAALSTQPFIVPHIGGVGCKMREHLSEGDTHTFVRQIQMNFC